MTCSVPQGSREYLYVPVKATVDRQPVTPIAVYVALRNNSDDPTESDWQVAEYTNGSVRFLLSGTQTRGRWSVWVRILDSSESVIRKSGVISIT